MPAYSVSLRMHRTLTAAAVFMAEIAGLHHSDEGG